FCSSFLFTLPAHFASYPLSLHDALPIWRRRSTTRRRGPSPVSQVGKVVSIQGPIVEVKFEPSSGLPAIHEIVETHTYDGQRVVLEVEEHMGNHVAKCIALASTNNVPRNARATALGSAIEVPVGKE